MNLGGKIAGAMLIANLAILSGCVSASLEDAAPTDTVSTAATVTGVSTTDAGQQDARDDSIMEAGAYGGILLGAGHIMNRITDNDGFADWGNRGSTNDYKSTGGAIGVLVGKRFGKGNLQVLGELDAMFADLSANTSRLDPACADEIASSRIRWLTALRLGIVHTAGDVRMFVSGGPTVAGIVNAVTDTDYTGPGCLNGTLSQDADDSFRSSSVEPGWVIGTGIEAPLSGPWVFRLDGSYMDFGRKTSQVNLSGNNSCGPGGARAPCSYTVRNRLAIVRAGLVYQF